MAKLKGNKKNNKLNGTAQNDKIVGRGGDDRLKGKGLDDKLVGGKGDDFLDGATGDDVMKGGGGYDFFEASEGNDFFKGGAGIDTVSFARSALGVSVEMPLQTTTQGKLNDGFKGIENIDGSAFSDTIEGDGAANTFRGLGGNDYLKGGDGNDVLDGGIGNDQMYFDSGADHLIGGDGFDSVVYTNATSGAVINLALGVGGGSAAGDKFSGLERVFGTKFADDITGGSASETFFGEAGNDELIGNGGADTLFGGAGQDDMFGGDGNDRLSPEGNAAEADDLYGGDGNDWVDYSSAGAGVTVNLKNNVSGGRAAGDTYHDIENVLGSSFGDTLFAGLNGRAYGGGGVDHIYDAGAPGGSEVLRGGAGNDHLYDVPLFGADDGVGDNFVLEVGHGVDTIHGFSTGDRYWLPEDQFSTITHFANGTMKGENLLSTGNNVATTASQRLIFDMDAADRILYYDADGNGTNAAPIAIAKIPGPGGSGLSSDFFVVVPGL